MLLAESGLVRIGTESRDTNVQTIERVYTGSLNPLTDFSTMWLISKRLKHKGSRDIGFNFSVGGIYDDKGLGQDLETVQVINDYRP